ncbi:MAG TPA: DUF3800 domain-containing protein [Longimicrobium sp.]
MPEFSDFIVFADESGDHGLATLDPNYPMFVLALCLFTKEEYAGITVPAVLRLKFKHFGHDQVILHEHEIRKTIGHFRFLTDANRRPGFYADLNALVEAAPFTLVAAAIHKEKHRARHTSPANPYHIALSFGLESLYRHLENLGCREGITHMMFEKRGAKEDAELELEFRRVCDGHNAAGRRFPFEIVMADKKCNSPGLQVADLVARPIGRHILDPAQPNRAYDVLSRKFRRGPGGSVQGWGLKVFT